MTKKLLFISSTNSTNSGNQTFTYTLPSSVSTSNPFIQVRPVSFYCINLFPNITTNNNTFTYTLTGFPQATLTLPVGNYSLTDIINYFENNNLTYVYDNITNTLLDG